MQPLTIPEGVTAPQLLAKQQEITMQAQWSIEALKTIRGAIAEKLGDLDADQLRELKEEMAREKAAATTFMAEIDKRMIELVGHSHDGQKTYEVGETRATITTGYNYTIPAKAKKKFDTVRKSFVALVGDEERAALLWPVKKEEALKVDKAKIQKLMEMPDSQDLLCVIAELVQRKAAAPSVKISTIEG